MKRPDCCYKERLERLNGIEERLNELKRKAAESDTLREERNQLRSKIREFRSKHNDELEWESQTADQKSRGSKIKKSEANLEKDLILHDENIIENIKQEFITQIRSLEEANQLLQDKVKEHAMNADGSAECLMIINEKLKKENNILQKELNNLNDRYKDIEIDKNSMPQDDNVMETKELEYVTQIRNLEVANQLLNKKLNELAKNDGGLAGNHKLQHENKILQNEFNDLKERFKGLAVKYENLEQQNSELSVINKVILKEFQNKLESTNFGALELTFAGEMMQIRNLVEQMDQHRPPKMVTFSMNEEILRKSQADELYKVGTQRGSTEPSTRQGSIELDATETKRAFKIGSDQYWNALRNLAEETEEVMETSHKLEALKNHVKEYGVKILPPPSKSIWGPNIPVD